jgi:TetR/AcrR family transcriptional repressor of nem operon
MAKIVDTRQKLLNAALELVWEEGLGSATVDDICDRAELTKGSFYHYFRSKADLVIAALETHWDGERVELDRIFSRSIPPVERLRGFFHHTVRDQKRKREQARRVLGSPYVSVGVACSSEDHLIRERVTRICVPLRKYFETALRDGKVDRSIPVKDIPMAVDTVLEFIAGAMSAARIRNSMEPIEKMGSGAFMILGLEWAVL